MTKLALFVVLVAAFIYACGDWTRPLPRALSRIYTPREWQLFFRVLGAFFFALVLLYGTAAQDLPAELFIYGRF